jgi:tungstate transport system substrate-binding protein
MRRTLQSSLAVILVLVMATFARADGFVFMASTIGPIDSGIVGALEDQFEKDTGIRVRHVGAGTGAALKIGEKGNVDLVMAHAKALEEKFIAEGFGTERIPLMYNDFVILGPAADPAGIRGMKTGAEALKAIAAKQALFVTRGDKSGTHVAEMDIWTKAGIKPAGPWYVTYEKGSLGNAPTTRFADSKGAYVFMDRATYLALKKEIKLVILVENDEALLNYISLIPVNPKKFPGVNYADTMTFVKWLTDPAKGQKIIADFGKDKYGAPLFFANSREWQAAQKKMK